MQIFDSDEAGLAEKRKLRDGYGGGGTAREEESAAGDDCKFRKDSSKGA